MRGDSRQCIPNLTFMPAVVMLPVEPPLYVSSLMPFRKQPSGNNRLESMVQNVQSIQHVGHSRKDQTAR